ncbi:MULTISPECIES: response regulator [Streptomyces]|uniref:response regulator n=1 Tax=Streptomyces TaxID=1883 RepID=UPI001E2AD31F|nr:MULTISPECIES: response regulator transcription factor [Streptomyces]UFQ17991.1 response regulator transcription factor [Streptomyces huasconensis]WCL87601.1 response regulator transcription factor [Streptomyces sp. JCM 35825]
MVVDDQAVVRAGFAAIVDAEPDLHVVAEAQDGAQAVRLARELSPDVVLMDIRMPGMDGLTATRLLTAEPTEPAGAAPRVLVLTTFDQDAYVHDALRAGASGFLLKDALPEELLAGIRVVASGEAMLAPTVTRRLIDAFADTAPAPDPELLTSLTPREREVLTLVAAGHTNAEIAGALGVTTGTVKSHVNALLGKLGLRDRVQATILAYDLGLARPRRTHRE